MVKCELCRKEVNETFMGKITGTYVVSGKKKKAVCNNCQKGNSLEEIRKKIH